MKKIILISLFLGIGFFTYHQIKSRIQPKCQPGKVIDEFNGVKIYCNGDLSKKGGRTLTEDGYNIGLKYECVEFVKRYYYEHYNHKMPDSYGNAKDFFNPSLKDGEMNIQRGLIQFKNGSQTKPKKGDLLILDATAVNQFGHVVIISNVTKDEVEVVQQNSSTSRDWYDLEFSDNKWSIDSDRALGWLRKTE